jgi:hypothetical protein
MQRLSFSDQEGVVVILQFPGPGLCLSCDCLDLRKVCRNGLMVASELLNFSHKHIGFNEAAFVESAHKIADSTGEVAGQVDHMKAIELTPDERGFSPWLPINCFIKILNKPRSGRSSF